MEGNKDILFVGIESPEEIKNVLQGLSKSIAVSMERYSGFKAIRQERLDYTAKFKKDIKEIYSLLNELKSKFPEPNLKLAAPAAKQKIAPVKNAPAEKPKAALKKQAKTPIRGLAKPTLKKISRAEINNLEAELKDIESKLNSLI